VSRVLSVVLMGRDTGHPHLLAPNLLTGGKGADLVIRGNVVLNKAQAASAGRSLQIDWIIQSRRHMHKYTGLKQDIIVN
jgi:hypothetical protein